MALFVSQISDNLGFWTVQTDNIIYSGAYASMGIDNSVHLGSFRDNFKVEVIRLTKDDMEFDMIGIDADSS